MNYKSLLLKLAVILVAGLAIAGCEYFKLMSYNEWVEYKEDYFYGGDDFPENAVFVVSISSSVGWIPDGSQEHPYFTIQSAIDNATLDGNNKGFVFVQSGTYNEQVNIKQGFSIFGGYTDNWEPGTVQSVISVNSSASSDAALVASGILEETIVRGFSIEYNPSASTAQAVYISGSNIVLRSCTIKAPPNNMMKSCVYAYQSDLTVENCDIILTANVSMSQSGINLTEPHNTSIIFSRINYSTSSDNPGYCTGIYASSANSTYDYIIENNTIVLAGDATADSLTGIKLQGGESNTFIKRNRISCYKSPSIAIIKTESTTGGGLYVYNNDFIGYHPDSINDFYFINTSKLLFAYNNTMYMQTVSSIGSAYFINCTNASSQFRPKIINNIFYLSGHNQGVIYGLSQVDPLVPSAFNNNNFYKNTSSNPSTFMMFKSGSTTIDYSNYTSTQMTVLNGTSSSTGKISDFGNIVADPGFNISNYGFADPNSLKPSNSTLKGAAQNLSGTFTNDINLVNRGSSWTIGAHQ